VNPNASANDGAATAATLRVMIVMGVSGAGKTEIGRALAALLGWRFVDADDYHSAANKEKMHRGEGLTDVDRARWLATLSAIVVDAIAHNTRTVLACSALKQKYRDALVPAGVPHDAVRFVYLDVPTDVLRARLERRKDHFAPPSLLDSQLATLEKPHDALWVDGAKSIDEITAFVRRALEL
jgi:gluconokinase